MVEYKNLPSSCQAVLDLRKELGLTQQEFADKVGVPQSTIARIEAGNSTRWSTLSNIAKAFGRVVKVRIVKEEQDV